MAKKSANKKTTIKQGAKVSPNFKLDNQTLEQWQVALRRQSAMKETFSISENTATDSPGCYTAYNATTRNEYKVVFRGEDSPWNYCSCMDFKTSQLGTVSILKL